MKEIMAEIKKMQGQMEDLRTSALHSYAGVHSFTQGVRSEPIERHHTQVEESKASMDDSKNTTFSFKNNTQIANNLLKRDNTLEVTIKPGESEYNDDFDRENTSSEGVPSARNNYISVASNIVQAPLNKDESNNSLSRASSSVTSKVGEPKTPPSQRDPLP